MRRLPLRPSFVMLGALSLTATLAGCTAAGAAEDIPAEGSTSGDSAETTPSAAAGADSTSAGSYADGDYSATGGYRSPAGEESVDVSVTLEGDVVTGVTVQPNAESGNSLRYQTAFAGGVADEVVGVPIDDLQVDKVAGSSLTSDGFNAAIEQIKGDAAA